MCFGNETQKTTNSNSSTASTSTATPAPWLTTAAQNNVNFASGLQANGFTPYSGPQVASFSPQQNSSFGLATDVAGATSPALSAVPSALLNYTTAPASSVSANPIYSAMSPYMNQYVSQALQPQLEAQNQQFATQNKGFDAGATGAGAFGDTSWALGKGNLTNQQDIARQGLVGAGAQDVANSLNASTTNANLNETALNRNLTGANAILAANTGAATLNNTFGGQQTAQSQAGLNAAYNQWLLAQQYPFQTSQLVNADLTAAKGAAPTTTSTNGTTNGTQVASAPDNSGWGIVGSLGAAALAPMTGGTSLMAIPGMLSSSQQTGSGAPLTMSPATGAGSYGNGYSYPMYADGGTPEPGKPAIVGERGPELFVPHEAGTVVPYEVLRAALAKRAAIKPETSGLARQLGIAA
jgi:hypothetical protein